MTPPRAFITDVGIVSPAGVGVDSVRSALTDSTCHLVSPSLFRVAPAHDHPVGQVTVPLGGDQRLPRTHRLALAALEQLSLDRAPRVDWICLGTTTGGMVTTEALLKRSESDPSAYGWHGLGTVARAIGERLNGPVKSLTFSTACSSGAVALIAGLALIRSGRARTVLAGGVESLCRLTVHGFSLLQIVDPHGARPLDANRKGMTVGEGAALFVLQAADAPPAGGLAEVVGGGLSCDAHHATAPDPQGRGAARAMQKALREAGLEPSAIDYLNLHGTGTPDNDAAEARAVHTVFGGDPPLLSSTKGTFGHSLAASGAVEAAIAIVCLADGLVPANVGLQQLDEGLELAPCREPVRRPLSVVMSNSLGFGGNNASVVLSAPQPSAVEGSPRSVGAVEPEPLATGGGRLTVLGAACLTGGGDTEHTVARFFEGDPCAGRFADADLAARFKGRAFRRQRRLPRLATWVSQDALAQVPDSEGAVDGVFWATGWGALTESYGFLQKLFASDGAFSSPIDFAASTHNAPAGQLAMGFGAQGPNVTTSGGVDSFWQAALATSLLADPGLQLLVAADEYHGEFTPLLQPDAVVEPADGAAALIVTRTPGLGPYLEVLSPSAEGRSGDPLQALLDGLGGIDHIRAEVGGLWLGTPSGDHLRAQRQEDRLVELFGDVMPVVGYRQRLGGFPTATGVAVVLALRGLVDEQSLATVTSGNAGLAARPGLPQLIIELGEDASALEVGLR